MLSDDPLKRLDEALNPESFRMHWLPEHYEALRQSVAILVDAERRAVCEDAARAICEGCKAVLELWPPSAIGDRWRHIWINPTKGNREFHSYCQAGKIHALVRGANGVQGKPATGTQISPHKHATSNALLQRCRELVKKWRDHANSIDPDAIGEDRVAAWANAVATKKHLLRCAQELEDKLERI